MKSMEWQEGYDTTGISSAVNKEKLHFHINDILRGRRQTRETKKRHISADFELPEEAPPFKDIV